MPTQRLTFASALALLLLMAGPAAGEVKKAGSVKTGKKAPPTGGAAAEPAPVPAATATACLMAARSWLAVAVAAVPCARGRPRRPSPCSRPPRRQGRAERWPAAPTVSALKLLLAPTRATPGRRRKPMDRPARVPARKAACGRRSRAPAAAPPRRRRAPPCCPTRGGAALWPRRRARRPATRAAATRGRSSSFPRATDRGCGLRARCRRPLGEEVRL